MRKFVEVLARRFIKNPTISCSSVDINEIDDPDFKHELIGNECEVQIGKMTFHVDDGDKVQVKSNLDVSGLK